MKLMELTEAKAHYLLKPSKTAKAKAIQVKQMEAN